MQLFALERESAEGAFMPLFKINIHGLKSSLNWDRGSSLLLLK